MPLFAPNQSDASSPTITATAGEALTAGLWYLDEILERDTTAKIYMLDADSTSPCKFGRTWGVGSGSVSSGASATMATGGVVTIGSGMTVGLPVYAHASTAGAVTQTRPDPSGGAQVAVLQIGLAASATTVTLDPGARPTVLYKTSSLSNGIGVNVSVPKMPSILNFETTTHISGAQGGLLNLWLKTDEGSGSTAADSSGFARDATLHSATWETVSGMSGKLIGLAGSSSSYVEIPAAASVANLQKYSVETVFKTTGAGNYSIYGEGNSGASLPTVWLHTYATFLYIDHQDNAGHDANLSTDPTVADDGNLHSAVLVRDGSSFKLYFDGALADSDTNGSIGATTINDIRLGGWNSNGSIVQPLNGMVGKVTTWSRALTAAEIADRWNSGNPIGSATVESTVVVGSALLDNGISCVTDSYDPVAGTVTFTNSTGTSLNSTYFAVRIL